jgi:hypothetical protein
VYFASAYCLFSLAHCSLSWCRDRIYSTLSGVRKIPETAGTLTINYAAKGNARHFRMRIMCGSNMTIKQGGCMSADLSGKSALENQAVLVLHHPIPKCCALYLRMKRRGQGASSVYALVRAGSLTWVTGVLPLFCIDVRTRLGGSK